MRMRAIFKTVMVTPAIKFWESAIIAYQENGVLTAQTIVTETAQNVIATLEHVKPALKVLGDQLVRAFAQRIVSEDATCKLDIAKNANLAPGADIAIIIVLTETTAHNVTSYQGTVLRAGRVSGEEVVIAVVLTTV